MGHLSIRKQFDSTIKKMFSSLFVTLVDEI
jgi:hypothetical protein